MANHDDNDNLDANLDADLHDNLDEHIDAELDGDLETVDHEEAVLAEIEEPVVEELPDFHGEVGADEVAPSDDVTAYLDDDLEGMDDLGDLDDLSDIDEDDEE
jgi:hypothetical protein